MDLYTRLQGSMTIIGNGLYIYKVAW